MWQVVINGPGYFDTAYELTQTLVSIGRAEDNDIVLSGELVSRKHARLFWIQDVLHVEDLASRNGIKVNEVPVDKTTRLKSGDILTIGDNQLVLRPLLPTEKATTDLVTVDSKAGASRVKSSQDSAVWVAQNVRESLVLKALDNVTELPKRNPFLEPTPIPTSFESERLRLLFRLGELASSAATTQACVEEILDRLMFQVRAIAVAWVRPQDVSNEQPIYFRNASENAQPMELPAQLVQRAWNEGEALWEKGNSLSQVAVIPVGAQPHLQGAWVFRFLKDPEWNEDWLEWVKCVGNFLALKINPPQSAQPKLHELGRLLKTESTLLSLHVEGLEEGRDAEFQEDWLQTILFQASETIASFHGHIVSTQGTRLTASFGERQHLTLDAVHAARAALKLQRHVVASSRASMDIPKFRFKLALHTGLVWMKDATSSVSYGPAVDLAECLSYLTPAGSIWVCESTLPFLEKRFEVRSFGLPKLPSVSGVRVYELLAEELTFQPLGERA